jgi:TPR repeat protein
MTLGYIYLSGKGLAQDFPKAFEWYKKAAEKDNVKAQAKLAWLYWTGNGGIKDASAAYAWMSIASANGYQPWIHRLARFLVKHSLTKEELHRADNIVAEQQKHRTTSNA